MGSAQQDYSVRRPILPAWMRWCVGAVEVALALLIAWQLAMLVFRFGADDGVGGAAPLLAARPAPQASDFSRLTGFDPFSRQLAETSVLAQEAAAPESSLKLDVFGLRAMGGGDGSAIVRLEGDDQKRVAVGDDIGPGVKLVGVYVDRLEISRGGAREAVFLRPQGPRAMAPAPAARPVAPARTPSGKRSNPVIAAAAGMIADLKLTPERRDGRIVGFRLGDDLPAALSALGLEGGDILMAANGAPLVSFERIEEIGEELAGADRLDLEIERRGERRHLNFGPNGKQ